MNDAGHRVSSKVPAVTLTFRVIKIAATTLGETGGDSVTMTLDWGYLTGTAIFLSLLVVLVILQIAAKRFHPFLYWATIVAIHHRRHDDGRFRRSIPRNRLLRRLIGLVSLPACRARPVVRVTRLDLGRNGQY